MTTTIATRPESQLVCPGTGEVVDLEKPDQCARALKSLRQLQDQIDEAKHVLTSILVAESRRRGEKTFEIGDMKVEIKGGPYVTYDEEILRDLLDCGLPEDRFYDLVKIKVEYVVSAREANRIAAASPEYAKIIERAKRINDRPYYVAFKA
ncbi:MAG: hypothetical protein QXT42_06355 [Thermoplasmata archaeon]